MSRRHYIKFVLSGADMQISRILGICMLGFLFAIVSRPVLAIDLNITASFQPDASRPTHNTFTNQTPQGGYCVSFPAVCKNLNMFSLELLINFYSNAPIQPDHNNPRAGAMFDTPVGWRQLRVVNSRTGEEEMLEIRITGIGSFYVLSKPASELVGNPNDGNAHATLWGGSTWTAAPPPCTPTGMSGGNATLFGWFWFTPAAGVCAKQAKFLIPSIRYGSLNIAYELRTPNPLGMSSGQYTGDLTYTIGPGMDFDMGDVMIPDDGAINMHFSLDVQHTLKIEVPPGGNRVELVPEGGWQAWLNRGRKPGRLLRDQTFNISASSRFKMQMECQFAAGDTCAIEDAAGNRVPLQVAVSLPAGLGREDGSPVHRQPLKLSGVGSQLFQPRFYVDRTPGTLHFEVQRADVEQMLTRDATTYKGNVTVIWDSEV